MLLLIIVVPNAALSLLILFLVFKVSFLGSKYIVPAICSGSEISGVVGVVPVVMLAELTPRPDWKFITAVSN